MHYLPSLLLLLRRSCTKARWRAETGEASEFGGALYALPCALIYPRARSTSARRSYTEARRAEGEKKRNPAKLQNGALILRIPARARAGSENTGFPTRARSPAASSRRRGTRTTRRCFIDSGAAARLLGMRPTHAAFFCERGGIHIGDIAQIRVNAQVCCRGKVASPPDG